MIAKNHNQLNVAISWSRLPPYAAHLIRAGISSSDFKINVVASRPVSLMQEVETIIEQVIHWIDIDESRSWADIGLDVPDIYFQSGWSRKAFNCLGEEVKANQGKVVCLSDNSWKRSFRQYLGALSFRLNYRKKFDAVWVPGKAGSHLMHFYGMPENRIYQGMYGSNPNVFSPGPDLSKRSKKFLFVGQLIERKGITLLLKAFEKFHKRFPDWILHIIGSGPLSIPQDIPNILYEGFGSPQKVSEAMRDSRFLILPSFEDHWGLVVHEAACSGCGLITSDSVGAALDLINDVNGSVFKTNSPDSLYQNLIQAATKSDRQLELAYKTSLDLADKFGTHIWPKNLNKIIDDLAI